MPDLAEDLAPADADTRLEQAEGIVRDYCGWHIAPSQTDTVRLFNVPRTGPLLLPTLNLTAIVSVTDQGTLVDPSAYDFDPAGILMRVDGASWAWGYGPIVVEFTHGYDDAPPGVTRVVQSVAAQLPNGLKSKAAGPFSESYFGELSPLDRSSLARYRIPVGP